MFKYSEGGRIIPNKDDDDDDTSQQSLNKKIVIDATKFMLTHIPDVNIAIIGKNVIFEMFLNKVGDTELGYHCLRTARTFNEITVNDDPMNVIEYMNFLIHKLGVIHITDINHLTLVDPIMVSVFPASPFIFS